MAVRYDLKIPGAPRLYLLLRSGMFVRRTRVDFVGRHMLSDETIVQVVDVIDPNFGGVIRSYAYVVGMGTLRLRKPCLSGNWPLMDKFVAKALGGASVSAYSFTGLGELDLSRKDH